VILGLDNRIYRIVSKYKGDLQMPQGFNSANRFAFGLLKRGVLRRPARAPQKGQIFRSIEGAVQKTSSKRRKS
jgi:hypothetical protein